MPVSLGPETDTFGAVLNALGSDAATYFGDPKAVLKPVQRIERRYSSLLRVRVRTAAGDSHAFVKVFKTNGSAPEEIARRRSSLENEYRTTLHLYSACASQPGLSPLRPLAIFPEQLAMVTTEVPGQTFDRVLRSAVWGLRAESVVINAASRVGTWVRAYQELTPHGKVTAGRAYLDTRLQALVGSVLTADDRDYALRAFDTLERLASAAPTPNVAIHGDLCAANIIIQPTGDVTVLDFSAAKTGTRYHDIAHLFMHLEFEASRMPLRRRFVASVQRALLAGFDPAASAADPLFKMMLLQHYACHVAELASETGGNTRWVQWLRRRWRRHVGLWTPAATAGDHP